MKILIRLPNWLGDMVMSAAFVEQLNYFFPGAQASVIVKKGLGDLLHFFPSVHHHYTFSKEEYKGLSGVIKFGKEISRTEQYDLFFSLPNSFSSAVMGFATGAKKRVGYRNEFREFLLTHSFALPKNIHRVETYARLLELYTNKKANKLQVQLHHQFAAKDYVVVNINSEASSRRLTKEKAAALLQQLSSNIHTHIKLIGAPKEKDFVDAVMNAIPLNTAIENLAGKTTMHQLAEVLASARLMITTDSGPAHLANALGTQTIILFGAGDEGHTAPYNSPLRTIIRLGKLSCEPCEKNVCVRYGIPQCLERLDTSLIVQTAKLRLDEKKTF